MPDQPLTVAELELLMTQAEQMAAHYRQTGEAPSRFIDWPGTLARVCRHALALEAEIARLHQLRLGAANEAQECRDENTRLRRQIEGHCDRIAAQAALLARRAERHEIHEDDGDAT
jgi:hypothetical protein